MWKRAEDKLRFAKRSILSCNHCDYPVADRDAVAAVLVRRSECETQFGVLSNEPAELASRIPARSQNSNRDSMHL